MKRLVCAVAVVAVLGLTSVALAAGGLSGKYKTVIHTTAFGGALNGTWIIKFSNGTYRATDNGHAVVHGTFKVVGNKVTVKDAKGPNACPVKGVYKFKFSGRKLRFREVSDSLSPACAGRVAVLAHTFKKVS
jgi:hypothetical protein